MFILHKYRISYTVWEKAFNKEILYIWSFLPEAQGRANHSIMDVPPVWPLQHQPCEHHGQWPWTTFYKHLKYIPWIEKKKYIYIDHYIITIINFYKENCASYSVNFYHVRLLDLVHGETTSLHHKKKPQKIFFHTCLLSW